MELEDFRAGHLEKGLAYQYFVPAAIISYNRWFFDCLATHILAFEGDS